MKILGCICMSLWHGDDVVAYAIDDVVVSVYNVNDCPKP